MESYKTNSPVAIIIYKRLEETKKVFKGIRQVKPEKLFVISDYGRNLEENKKVDAVREYVLENIDWECEVFKNFAEANMGCKQRVSSGISWVFNQVERAIILEDDIVPSVDFFIFCDEMLERYKDDERIMSVSGYKTHTDYKTEKDYFFSSMVEVWGWATWKRAWNLYDITMKEFNVFLEDRILENLFPKKYAVSLQKSFQEVYDNRIDTWDYQWVYSILVNSGLTIVPKNNLIQNIGFNSEEATHTKGGTYFKFPIGKVSLPIKENNLVVREYRYDSEYIRNYLIVPFEKRIIRRLKRG